MKKKKRNIYFIIAGVLLIIYLIMNIFMFGNKNEEMQVYKDSAVNDCANYTNNINEAIDLTKQAKSLKMVEDKSVFNFDDYEKSNCVKFKGMVVKDYITLKNYPIIHQKGQNNQAYQLSYQVLYDELKKIEHPTDMDKKMMSALEYFINSPYSQANVDGTNEMFKYYDLTGPGVDDPSGTYYPVVDLKILENEIYSKDKGKLKLVSTKYILDDIMIHYEMGE